VRVPIWYTMQTKHALLMEYIVSYTQLRGGDIII